MDRTEFLKTYCACALPALCLVFTPCLIPAAAQIRLPGNIIQRGIGNAIEQARREREARQRERARQQRETQRQERQSTPVATQPQRGPTRTVALASKTAECDRLAGHPADPMRRGAGVTDENIDLIAGLETCAAAVAADKTNPRLLFQAGRVLWLAEEFEEAMPFLLDAAEAKEPAALAYMGDAYANGLGGAEEDLQTALAFYAQAAEAGFAPASAAADEVAEELAGQNAPQQIARASGSAADMNECDRLAAHPDDPNKLGAGIGDAQVSIRSALAACETARLSFPNTPRLDYQYGRVLVLADRSSDALPVLAAAAENGYAPARALIADAYLAGAGGAEQDIGAAYSFYEEAAAAGFTPAKAKAAELRNFVASTAAVPTGAAGAAGADRIALTCEWLGTVFSDDMTPVNYVTVKPEIVLDYRDNTASVSGEVLTVTDKSIFSKGVYPLENGSDGNIRFKSDTLGPLSEGGVLTINAETGAVTYSQKYQWTQFFRPIYNTITIEGYCAPKEAAKPSPKPSVRKTAARKK